MVVPGHTSGDVGPVVAIIRDIRVEPILGVSRTISDGALVRVRGIVVGHSAHDTEVGIIRYNRCAVGSRVIENSLTDSAFRAIESNGVRTRSFKGDICPGRRLKITYPGKGNEGCKDARNQSIASTSHRSRTVLRMLRVGGNTEPVHASPFQRSSTSLTALIDKANRR